jgi:hypothetical protein
MNQKRPTLNGHVDEIVDRWPSLVPQAQRFTVAAVRHGINEHAMN